MTLNATWMRVRALSRLAVFEMSTQTPKANQSNARSPHAALTKHHELEALHMS